MSSLPPRVKAGAEVLLSPWAQGQLALNGGGVSQGQGQWGRATHHLAVLVVLGAMARAAELVGGLCSMERRNQGECTRTGERSP